ncbi:PrsW family intramembrane metalloprotease [Gryllotalpicola koreensis]|uniref:PrsW family intramembrane metalloprotease n=1 Tax=Gryllotalpicola koreensis TaxID=993086 RepID=A0ABP7ZX96_9MICO
MSVMDGKEGTPWRSPGRIALGDPERHGWWWKTLMVGWVLWLATITVTVLTGNPNLVPTLILLGSFLVPFCVVLFAVERLRGNVTALQLILAFFVSGVAGVLGASLLEANLQQSLWLYGLVGLIEEFVKGCILVVLGWRLTPKSASQGALLGATVGAGFAAFESAGYAFNAALGTHGIDLAALLRTEVIRALLAPVGHILWTAIIGAALFGIAGRRARPDDPGYTWSIWVAVAYLGAAVLHALWDSMSSIASLLALLATGNTAQLLQYGFLLRRDADAVQSLSSVLYVCGLIVVSLAGVVTLWAVIRHYRPRMRRGRT